MKDVHNIDQLKQNGLKIKDYMDKLTGEDGEVLKDNFKNYQPKKEILEKLGKKAKGFLFVVFSATWCKDCKKNVGYFAKLLEMNHEIDAIFFSGIKSAPLDPNIRWKVPPSPPEVNDFDLIKIPTFYILNSKGKVVGQMIENPEHKDTLEEELLYLFENI